MIDIVTRLITEAVGTTVPIMTEAVAAAPATFGQSLAVRSRGACSSSVSRAGRRRPKASQPRDTRTQSGS